MYKSNIRKSLNRDRIIECIYRNSPISRKDISNLTEITPATVTNVIFPMIEDGIVEELGEIQSEDNIAGRKKINLSICKDYGYAIGVEFNAKALCCCATDMKGNVIIETSKPYTQDLADNITNYCIQSISDILSNPILENKRIVGIGIAVPGQMDASKRKIKSNHYQWKNFDTSTIKDKFNPIPVVAENNARSMALSQYLFNAQNTPDSFAYFHVGLGMFCSNIINGELFLGNSYVSGEIGHTIVIPDGLRCECGKHGCLQTIASEHALLKKARQLYEYNKDNLLHHLVSSVDDITIDTIATAYVMGEKAIRQYVMDALKYLSISVSNIAIIMNPEKIYLHGQIFSYPEIYAEIFDLINNQLLFVDQNYVNTVEVLNYNPNDGAVGAAALALMQFFVFS